MEGRPSLESKEKLVPKAYFSISNLVRRCHIVHVDGSHETVTLAILGGKTKNGAPRFQAIGGGVKLADEAIAQLKVAYPHIEFRGGEEADDARFYIPMPQEQGETEEAQKEAQNIFVHKVMDQFNDPKSAFFKDAPKREIIEELTQAKNDAPAPLTEEDVQDIQIDYEGAVSPVQWHETTSGRAGSSAHYFRTFHLYDITLSEEVFKKLQSSPRIRILSSDDVSAIREATETGNAATQLPDGSVIVENIFP